eukprot:TRINITY_DN47745_c0_g1_i1.p1 TRINITY_DN47745_c0_g1~~TRINITY_DN47745_c0_g1_i1.p1  ORF type:complete len:387 (+),score=108.70 TRINITY_DN47745_c0_g1_i1:126-1286(+)
MTFRTALFLAFGDRRIEVLSGGGFESICAQAEAALGLSTKSFELFDEHGKVESQAALQRALTATKGAPCIIEVRERPEWQRIRQMELHVQMLLAREHETGKAFGRFVGQAMSELEERILSKVAAEVLEIKESVARTEAKVDAVTYEQRNLKEHFQTEIDAIKERTGAMEVEANEQAITNSYLNGRLEVAIASTKKEIETLQPLVRKVEEIDLEISEQAITASALNAHLEHGVSAAKLELETMRSFTTERIQTLLKADSDLRAELATLREDMQQTNDTASALEKEVQRLKPAPGSPDVLSKVKVVVPYSSTPLEEQKWVTKVTAEQSPVKGLQWSDGFASHSFSSIPFSQKGQAWQKSSSFVSGSLPSRQVERLSGSRSVPSLFPVM